MAAFIQQDFIPVEAHIKEHPAWFSRFDALWTPTVLLLDSGGKERVRLEGYLNRTDFTAWLAARPGRLAFTRKQSAEAERRYDHALQTAPAPRSAPEAMYWHAVSHYRASNDHTALGRVAEGLPQRYPGSVWAEKALPWKH
ncbi:MAG: hypothetical protein ACRD1C_08260 [Terriglobales bacterium]